MVLNPSTAALEGARYSLISPLSTILTSTEVLPLEEPLLSMNCSKFHKCTCTSNHTILSMNCGT